jgi:hypothetical protein
VSYDPVRGVRGQITVKEYYKVSIIRMRQVEVERMEGVGPSGLRVNGEFASLVRRTVCPPRSDFFTRSRPRFPAFIRRCRVP